MYKIQIKRQEIETILKAIRDSRERLNQQVLNLRSSYFNLPPNLKLLWRDELAYNKYKDDAIHACFRDIEEISKLEEKLEEILDKT